VYLQKITHTNIEKLNRETYYSGGSDSIEHIYPQKSQHSYWINQFKPFTTKQRTSFRNSLGNFVAISVKKNSKLANKPFPEKRDGKSNHIAYKYGTYAEIELTKYENWGPDEIYERGLALVAFLQERWGYKIGTTKQDKVKFLGLGFYKQK
jgi:hypothetical protein